jgi:hypothetical protein
MKKTLNKIDFSCKFTLIQGTKKNFFFNILINMSDIKVKKSKY